MMIPRAHAVRADGSKLLYRCSTCGRERWKDFAAGQSDNNGRGVRVEAALAAAQLHLELHSPAKGGVIMNDHRCSGSVVAST